MNSDAGSEVEQLREKYGQWLHSFSGDEPNSITNQIQELNRNSAFYHAFNAARHHIPQRPSDGQAIVNDFLHLYIDKANLALQLTGIRRLMDRSVAEGSRGVHSLRNLIEDIGENARLITRQNVFGMFGLELDVSERKRQESREALVEAVSGKRCRDMGNSMKVMACEMWHSHMDLLCGVKEYERQDTDSLDVQRCAEIVVELENICEPACEFANKFIAHASTTESQKSVPEELLKPTMYKMWLAEAAVCKVASFVSVGLLDGPCIATLTLLPFGSFKHLDCLFSSGEAEKAMQTEWDAHESRLSSCARWNWRESLICDYDLIG